MVHGYAVWLCVVLSAGSRKGSFLTHGPTFNIRARHRLLLLLNFNAFNLLLNQTP